MSRFTDRVGRNTRANWPSMLALLLALLAYEVVGPVGGLVGGLVAVGVHEYRRKRVQE
jgi:hypothetical protein